MRTIYRVNWSFTASNGFHYAKGTELVLSEYNSLTAAEKDNVEIVRTDK